MNQEEHKESPKRKVLVVEDDKFLSELVCRKLELSGLSVQAVSDGESALKTLESQPMDVILLDLLLPGID